MSQHCACKTTRGSNIFPLKEGAEYASAGNSLRSLTKRFFSDRMTSKRFILISRGNIECFNCGYANISKIKSIFTPDIKNELV